MRRARWTRPRVLGLRPQRYPVHGDGVRSRVIGLYLQALAVSKAQVESLEQENAKLRGLIQTQRAEFVFKVTDDAVEVAMMWHVFAVFVRLKHVSRGAIERSWRRYGSNMFGTLRERSLSRPGHGGITMKNDVPKKEIKKTLRMEVVREKVANKGLDICEWERRISQTLDQKNIRVCTLSFDTVSSKPSFYVALYKMFPVLEGAELCACSASRFDMEACFETAHGSVLLLAAFDAAHCQVNVGKATGTNTLEIRTSEGHSCKIMLTLVVERACACCGASDKPLRRCARCWERLGFPIYYCGKHCQTAHFPEHRKRGCGFTSSPFSERRPPFSALLSGCESCE